MSETNASDAPALDEFDLYLQAWQPLRAYIADALPLLREAQKAYDRIPDKMAVKTPAEMLASFAAALGKWARPSTLSHLDAAGNRIVVETNPLSDSGHDFCIDKNGVAAIVARQRDVNDCDRPLRVNGDGVADPVVRKR